MSYTHCLPGPPLVKSGRRTSQAVGPMRVPVSASSFTTISNPLKIAKSLCLLGSGPLRLTPRQLTSVLLRPVYPIASYKASFCLSLVQIQPSPARYGSTLLRAGHIKSPSVMRSRLTLTNRRPVNSVSRPLTFLRSAPRRFSSR